VNPLFDTTDLIFILRGQPEALRIFDLATRNFDEVYTSTMNVAEVYGGMRRGEEKKTAKLIDSMTLLPVTLEIARRAGELKAEWSRKGRTLGLADMIVAATALEHGLTLVTQNRKDFPVEGLAFWP
jgi:predicted nucleic acid-binding protein